MAYGILTSMVASLFLFIEIVDLRATVGDEKHAGYFLSLLWALALFNGLLLLLRTVDKEWVSQLRRKNGHHTAWTHVRGFDIGDPLFWSVFSAIALPVGFLGPQTADHEPLLLALVISTAIGLVGMLLMAAGRVRLEVKGIRTGHTLSAFDKFVSFDKVDYVSLKKHILTVRTRDQSGKRLRTRRLLVLRGSDRLRGILPKVVPSSVRLVV